MKTRTTLILLLMAIITIAAGSAFGSYSGGTGEPNNPYQIWTPEDMNTIGANSSDWSKCFILMADVDMSICTGTQYNIIGNETTQFTGTFDGNGHKIRNLTYTTTAGTNFFVGLFGYTSNATIKNLGLENVNIYTGRTYAGGLVGYQSYGTITSCYSTGSVASSSSFSSSWAGGLVGYQSYGTITSCYSTGTVVASSSSSASWAGGLVGQQNSGTVTYCYSTGAVVASSSFSSYAGGLVGQQYYSSTITSCYSTGAVVASSSSSLSYAGGLVGACVVAVIEKCYSTGPVFATGQNVHKGGLLGFSSGTVTACFWDTQTSGLTTSVGGTGETTSQMRMLSTFTSAGWDFTNETANGTNDYWRMCVDGVDYPRLNWQSPVGDLACPDGVNFVDFAYFAGRWLESDCALSNNFCGGTDMDSSGTVDMQDLAMFAENWLSGE